MKACGCPFIVILLGSSIGVSTANTSPTCSLSLVSEAAFGRRMILAELVEEASAVVANWIPSLLHVMLTVSWN